ncbi:MAG: VWA domain-containing protein [Microthrixaceae bacterium]|nr:VWA domain-containing protein [Microthrixaceae bacterium]
MSHPARGHHRPVWRTLHAGAGLLSIALIAAACGFGGDDTAEDDGSDCTQVPAAVSSEKIELMGELADDFNSAWDGPGCVRVTPESVSSGRAALALADGWDADEMGVEPVLWSPAASSWGAILNQRSADGGGELTVPADPPSFMLTPLVIAMPEPMAEALGYPDEPVGWSDLLALATEEDAWEKRGHPEWGQFKLGKTNPNYSTSGLSALVAQNYAAAGAKDNLTAEQLKAKKVVDFNKGIESSVVHYGDITMTFLNNWFRADERDTALTYASAVAVEEKSVIDYNSGNPDGILEPGEQPRKPRVPLVSIYPTEGTLYSDNPLYVVGGSDAQQDAAEQFVEFLQEPANQKKVLDFGFRPANPEVPVGNPIVTDNGVDPDQPTTTLPVPDPEVLNSILEAWDTQRKGARVLMMLDVSGSMSDPARAEDPGGPTKLDLAKQAATTALEQFKADDEVGLRTFTTDENTGEPVYDDLVEIEQLGSSAEGLRSALRDLIPRNGTPLFGAAQVAFEEIEGGYDPERINAVILLTDGINEDGDPSDDDAQFKALTDQLRAGSEGEASTPVRVFTIAYGEGASTGQLSAIAEASNAAAYDSSDPDAIDQVFTAVVSNF